jgi:hypothetical protein
MRYKKLKIAKKRRSRALQRANENRSVSSSSRAGLPAQRDRSSQIQNRPGSLSSRDSHAALLNHAMTSQPPYAHQVMLQLQRQHGNRYVQQVLTKTENTNARSDIVMRWTRSTKGKLGSAKTKRAKTVKEHIGKVKIALDLYKKGAGVKEAIDKVISMEGAWKRWEKVGFKVDNSDELAIGIAFARSYAELFPEIKKILPTEGLPDFVVDALTGYLDAVPKYVDALTQLLWDRIKYIDEKTDLGEVTYKTATGTISKIEVEIIKALPKEEFDEGEKGELFRTACHIGLTRALENKGWGKIITD